MFMKRILDVSRARQLQPVCVPGRAPVFEHGHLHDDPHSGTRLRRARDDATRHSEGDSVQQVYVVLGGGVNEAAADVDGAR